MACPVARTRPPETGAASSVAAVVRHTRAAANGKDPPAQLEQRRPEKDSSALITSSVPGTANASAAGQPRCIDLAAAFGDRFRVERDPAYSAEHGIRGQSVDPWLLTIPCRFGHVFPWGGDRLALSTNGRGPTARALACLPFVRVEQEAGDGYTISFPVDRFEEVAQLAKPKRKRAALSDERREALIAAGAESRFRSEHGANRSKLARIPAPAA